MEPMHVHFVIGSGTHVPSSIEQSNPQTTISIQEPLNFAHAEKKFLTWFATVLLDLDSN